MNQAKQESIERLAFQIYKDRCRRGDPEACNEKDNYFHALKVLYPEEVKDECLNNSRQTRYDYKQG